MSDNSSDIFKGSALTTILVVSDMEKAKQFYLDVLGASLYREYGGDSVVLEFLENWLLLVLPGEPTTDKPDTWFVASKDKTQVSHAFTIRVDDCQLTYEMLKQRGAIFITPPITNGNETRCFFRDPDDHLFEISEYRAS
jgi:catechol 2,3-dioxygenase-like lactoylglutathione lyase family enzyme